MALRTLDGSLVGAIIAFQGEGPTGNPSPKGTFLMPPVGDIFIALQQTCFWRLHEERLAEASRSRADPKIPSYYHAYRQQHQKTVREAIVNPGYFVPRDLQELGSEEEVRRMVQGLVRDHGRLLEHWPDIVQAARELHEKGVRLTRLI